MTCFVKLKGGLHLENRITYSYKQFVMWICFVKNQRNETLRNRYKVDIESSEIVRLDLV